MKQQKWKIYAFWIVLAQLTGGLAGWLTRDGAELYRTSMKKPPLSPPGVVFPIVWAILFLLMGVGMARVALSSAGVRRDRCRTIFLLQLAWNFFWSILFFNLQRYGLSFFWLAVLWVLILWMIRAFSKVDPTAAWLQAPYLLWVTFAGYLNLGIWRLNG